VQTLAARAAYVLLLTATPHSGDQKAFNGLRDLGSAGDDDQLVAFRRTRGDVRAGTRRRLHTLRVRPTRHEQRVHAALARYGDAVRAEQPGAWLGLSVLHKRAFSSAWSLARSIDRRLAALAARPAIDADQMTLPLGDPSGVFTTADEAPEWPGLALADPSERTARRCRGACRAVSRTKQLAAPRGCCGAPASPLSSSRSIATSCICGVAVRLPLVILHGGLSRQERLNAPGFRERTGDSAGHRRRGRSQPPSRLPARRQLELPWNPCGTNGGPVGG
jgi:hypothetical protein